MEEWYILDGTRIFSLRSGKTFMNSLADTRPLKQVQSFKLCSPNFSNVLNLNIYYKKTTNQAIIILIKLEEWPYHCVEFDVYCMRCVPQLNIGLVPFRIKYNLPDIPSKQHLNILVELQATLCHFSEK